MPVTLLRYARLAGWVTYCSTVYAQVQCRKPKTGQEKVQLYCEDDSHFLSSYYLSIHSPHPTHTRKNTDSTAQRIYIYTEGKAAPFVFNTVNLSFALESRTL